MTKHLLYVFCFIACVCSCSVDVKYSKYRHISRKGWDSSDTILFNTDTLRQGGRYSFTCGIRTRRSYPYRDIVMMVDRKVYRDSLLVLHKLEKVTCPIINVDGDMTGEGIASKNHEQKLKDFYMQTGDSIVISINHQMTRKSLSGIVDVGIIMEKL